MTDERLRTLAAKVCWFDWSNNDSDAVEAVNDLRKALSSMDSDLITDLTRIRAAIEALENNDPDEARAILYEWIRVITGESHESLHQRGTRKIHPGS